MLLAAGVGSDVAPGRDVLDPLQRALEHYADTVHSIGGGNPGEPPAPSLAPLCENGISVVGVDAYRSALRGHADRRQTLHQIVRSDGWSWPDVTDTDDG